MGLDPRSEKNRPRSLAEKYSIYLGPRSEKIDRGASLKNRLFHRGILAGNFFDGVSWTGCILIFRFFCQEKCASKLIFSLLILTSLIPIQNQCKNDS